MDGRGVIGRVLRSSILTKLGKHEIGALAAIFAAASLLLLFGELAEDVGEGDTHRLDNAVILALGSPTDPADRLGPPWFEEMMRDVTALGSYAFIVIAVVAAVSYLLLIRKRGAALLTLAAVFGGIAISNVLKTFFDRPRPDLEQATRVFSASFPSGHATLSAVTFLTLAVLLTRTNDDRRVKIYFLTVGVILTLLVGSSRVYLGVHYPSDVLAGWCVGSAWAMVCWAVALWLQRRGSVEPSKSGSSDDVPNRSTNSNAP